MNDLAFPPIIDDRPTHAEKLVEVATEVVDRAEITGGKPLVKYSATEAGLAALRKDLAGKTYDLKTVKGNDEARGDRLRRVTLRTTLEKRRKAFKEPALEYGKLIDAEAKRITAEIVALETPIDDAIRADETRRAAEKAERERIEAERVAKHQAAIATIRNYVALANTPGMTAAKLTRGMVALQAMVFGEEFEEFAGQAEAARDEALAALEVLHGTATLREAEAEAAERQRVENERVAAENRRIAAELAEQQRKIDEARAALERQQREAEEAARRQAEEAAAAQRRADEEAEARERAEHARLEAERIAELTKDAPKPGDDDPIDSPALVAESAPVVSAPAVVAAPEVKPVPADCIVVHGEVCMATGALCVRLGFVIGGERLKEWGFTPLTTAKGPGMYWRLSDLPAICDALIARLQAVKEASK